MARSFSAQVDKWVLQTQDRMERVAKESIKRVVKEMQKPVAQGGNMPVDTGFLRASLQSGLNAKPNLAPEGRSQGGAEEEVELTIAQMKIGDTYHAAYGANYAAAVEFGGGGRQPRAFVRSAAKKWGQIVKQVAKEAQARAKG